MPLLLLPERHTPDDSNIWRAAIRRGWSTERVSRHTVRDRLGSHRHMRYYGSWEHWFLKVGESVPRLTMIEVNPEVLPRVAHTHRFIQLMEVDTLPVRTAPAFIKPVASKWFEARVYQPGEKLAGEPLLNDLLYVQTPVTFLDEVRCFCLAGRVLTSSLYRINREVYSATDLPPDQINYDERLADSPIPQYVADIWREHGDHLPMGLVIDFGRHPDGTWSLIEFNEAWASGLYHCDPNAAFDCIVASQTQASQISPLSP